MLCYIARSCLSLCFEWQIQSGYTLAKQFPACVLTRKINYFPFKFTYYRGRRVISVSYKVARYFIFYFSARYGIAINRFIDFKTSTVVTASRLGRSVKTESIRVKRATSIEGLNKRTKFRRYSLLPKLVSFFKLRFFMQENNLNWKKANSKHLPPKPLKHFLQQTISSQILTPVVFNKFIPCGHLHLRHSCFFFSPFVSFMIPLKYDNSAAFALLQKSLSAD